MGKLFVTLFPFLPAGRQVLLHSRQIRNGSCTRTPALLAIKILSTLTNFWLRDSLCRDTAPVITTNFVTGDRFAASIRTCTATPVMLNKLCTWTAKSEPYLPCTPAAHCVHAGRGVTTFWLKTRTVPGASSGNRPSLQAGSSLSRHNMSGLYARPSILPGR